MSLVVVLVGVVVPWLPHPHLHPFPRPLEHPPVPSMGEAKGSRGEGRGEGVLKALSPHPAVMEVVPIPKPVLLTVLL